MANHSAGSAHLKRGLDIVVSAAGLLVVGPLLALLALAIRAESRGPALFRQQRVGRGFARFTIYKLRTMRVDGGEGPMVTSGRDVRITRLGRLLRRAKLDELPQLWNVLRGDMSLVGPRPEVPHYVELFHDDYAEVLTVRPGVTDLASLAFRDEEALLADFDDPEWHYVSHVLPAKIALNKDYARRSSIAFDLEIIMKTVLEALWLRLVPAGTWLLRRRGPFVIALHVTLIIAANYGAFWLRFDGDIPAPEVRLWLGTVLLLCAVRIPFLALFKLYQGLWSYTSVYDLQAIMFAVAGSELVFFALVRGSFGLQAYPRSVFILDALLLVFLMGALRLAKRFYESAGQLRGTRRALIVGGGDRADFVIRAMKSRVLGDYRPVGIVSAGFLTQGRIHGVPVVGTVQNLGALARSGMADEIILAYDRGNQSEDRAVLEALEGVSHPVRDAFQLMVTVVDREAPAQDWVPDASQPIVSRRAPMKS